MFCPTAAPGYASGVHWDIINTARSVDNGMFAVYSNRIGTEWEKVYFGDSMIISPHGEVMARGGNEKDAIVSAELDLAEVDKTRIAVSTLRDARRFIYKLLQLSSILSAALITYSHQFLPLLQTEWMKRILIEGFYLHDHIKRCC